MLLWYPSSINKIGQITLTLTKLPVMDTTPSDSLTYSARTSDPIAELEDTCRTILRPEDPV
jgi:hypothetical protein